MTFGGTIGKPMPTGDASNEAMTRLTERRKETFPRARSSGSQLRWVGFLWSGLLTVSSTTISLLASPHLGQAAVLVIYLLGAVIIALRFGIAVAVFSAVTNVLVFDYIFITPPWCFSLPDLSSAVTCGGMLTVALVVSGLTTRLRQAEASARARETRASVLYALSHGLADATSAQELAIVGASHFERLTGAPAAVLIRDEENVLASPVGSLELDPHELERVREVWASGGRQLPSTEDRRSLELLPLVGAHSPVGFVLFGADRFELFKSAEEREIAEVCAEQTAMAVERSELDASARSAQLSVETERARSALLSSLSHDFRTPLAAIVGAGNSLVDLGSSLDSVERQELAQTIVEESERLHRLLTNVLALTRLEQGSLSVKKTPCALEEIVDSAVRRLTSRLDSRRIDVDAPADLPMVSLEPMLTEQLITNVLENALRYTPSGSSVDVRLRWIEPDVSLTIADRGPGVPPGDESRIFDKFFRSASADRRDGGMGLGLAICRAIARAHDGRIEARNRAGGGLEVTFSVPRAHDPAVAEVVSAGPESAAQGTSP